MESRPIFLSMAAIDIEKAEANRWLPGKLFPLRTHRIAASRRSDYGYEFPFVQCKRYVRKSGGLSLQGVIGVMDMFEF